MKYRIIITIALLAVLGILYVVFRDSNNSNKSSPDPIQPTDTIAIPAEEDSEKEAMRKLKLRN